MSGAVRYRKPRELLLLGRRHGIVEASAGTGKTYLLEHLVIDLLLGTDATLEQILVVTFTEKATAELTHRVRRKLQELLELTAQSPRARAAEGAPDEECWTLDDGARERLRRALYGFDRAGIFTIHGFCQRILIENAFTQGRLFDEEAIDEREAFHAALVETLRRDVAVRPGGVMLLEAWRRAGNGLPKLEKVLLDCQTRLAPIDRPRDEVLRPAARLDPARLELAVAAWPMLDEGDEPLRAAMQRCKIHHSTVRALGKRIGELSAALREGRDGTAALLAALERLDRAQKKRDGIFRFVHDTIGPKGDAEPLLARLRGALLALDAAVPPLGALLAGELLAPVAARLERRKREAGLFDFQDMLTLVARSLDPDSGDGPAQARARELIATLRARYRYALVDEFQDTDEIQWRIFRRLFFDGHERGALTLVGDPKQAIYGFRGADVHAYLRARAEVEAVQPAVYLSASFRATRPLIEAQNVLFDDQDPQPFFRKGGPIRYDHPVSCGQPELALVDGRGRPAAPVVVLELDKDPAFSGAKLRFWEIKPALLDAICREIAALLGTGRDRDGDRAGQDDAGGDQRRLYLRRGTDPRGEAIRPGQVFVLTRTIRESREIGEALRAARIPFSYFKQEKLFDTVEAREVLDVLRAIAEPDNRTARLRAFITAFFGLTLPDLAACDELPADHPLLARLQEWRALAEAGQLDRLFARIVDDSGIIRRDLFERAGERALTNTLHLFELLQDEAARTRCTIRELVQRLASYINGTRRPPGREGDVQRLETDADTVQVMTIHQSKGLEAAAVFIYGATWPGPRGDVRAFHDERGERMVRVGRQPEAEEPLFDNEQTDEERRVLYVALTRAQARLYLPHYPRKPLCDLRGNYSVINDRLHAILGGITPDEVRGLFERRAVRAPLTARVAADGAALGPAIAAWTPPPALLLSGEAGVDPLFREAREGRAGFLMTSYSAVKRRRGGAGIAAGPDAPPPSAADDAPGLGDEGEGELTPADELSLVEETARGAFAARAAAAGAAPGGAGGPRAADVATADELPRGRLSGRFLHEVIERLPLETLAGRPTCEDWVELPEVRALFERTARRHDRRPAHLPHAQRLIHTALTAPVRLGDVTVPSLAGARHPRREVEFLFPIPERAHPLLGRAPAVSLSGVASDDGPGWPIERGVVKGFIDLLFQHDERIYVCDWKGDGLPDWREATVAAHCEAHYRVQAQLYTLATLRLLGVTGPEDFERRFGGVLYCFLRGMSPDDPSAGVFFRRPSFAEVAGWERAMLEPGYWGRG